MRFLSVFAAVSLSVVPAIAAPPAPAPAAPPIAAQPPTSITVQVTLPAAQTETAAQRDGRDPMVTWNHDRGIADVGQILRSLDEVCPQNIVLGEGVSGRKGYGIGIGKPRRLSLLLDVICMSANLTWGYLNRDTIIVLPTRANFSTSEPQLGYSQQHGRATEDAATGDVPDWAKSYVDRAQAQARAQAADRILNLLKPRTTPVDPNTLYYRTPLPSTPRYTLPLNPDPALNLRSDRPSTIPNNARAYTFNGQTFYLVPTAPQHDEQPKQ